MWSGRDAVMTVLAVLVALGAVVAAVVMPQGDGGQVPGVPMAPEKGSVRAAGGLSVDVVMERSVVGAEDGSVVAMVEVSAPPKPADAVREPVSIALVIDVSSSMAGNKFNNALKAVHGFVDRLGEGDRLSVVAFSTQAVTVLDGVLVGEDRQRLHETVDRSLAVDSWTCLSCGLERAYEVLASAPEGHQRRVVVLSDGEANRGVLDQGILESMARVAQDRSMITTSTIGVGRAIDGPVLASVSSGGAGAYYFLRNSASVGDVLGLEMAQMEAAAAVSATLVVHAPVDGSVAWANGRLKRGDLALGRLLWGSKRRILVPVALSPGHPAPGVEVEVVFERPGGGQARVEAMAELAFGLPSQPNGQVSLEIARRKTSHVIDQGLMKVSSGDVGGARSLLAGWKAQLEALEGRLEEGVLSGERLRVEETLGNLETFADNAVELQGAALLNGACQNEVSRGVGAEAINPLFLSQSEVSLE